MEIKLDIKNHAWLLLSIVGFVFFFMSIFSYIQTEILSSRYLSEVQNSQQLCSGDQNSDLKFIKMVSYEKSKKAARLFCIYQNSDKNIQIDIYFNQDQWYISFTKRLNRERNFYWPVYY